MKKLMIVSALVLAAIGTPALAQTATPSTHTSSNTPTPSPTPSCSFNCANTTSIMAGTTVIFGGSVVGAFGSFDADGNVVANPNMTGKVEFVKDGGGNSTTELTYGGSICGPLCGTTTLNAKGKAWETGSVKVTGMSTVGGINVGAVNSGALTSATQIQFGVQNGTPSTHTAAPSGQ